ncbi:MAG: hypothetical protein SVW77_00660 [Candidatus Nanohaloarchaea archaeon]|nr:hypothetical protein [Candidatus Nanohaloarchaea archaeon]
MGESWTDKTVSLGNVEQEEFDASLAHVTVSENGITVEFKDVEDWKRIRREIGEEKILQQVRWEAVEDVETETEHLYYPHIDISTDDLEQRIYFLQDEEDLLEGCRNAIKRFWNAYRDAGSGSRNSYSYDGETETAESDGDSDDEVELEEDSGQEDDEEGDAEDDGSDDEDGSVEDVVEEFMDH